MRDDCNVDVKRQKIKTITALLKTIKSQQGNLNEKSRHMLAQIKDIGKCVVIFSDQTAFNVMNNKIGKLGSSDFVSSDSMSSIPIEEFTSGLKMLIQKVKTHAPGIQANNQSQPTQKHRPARAQKEGNRLPQMMRLRSESLDESAQTLSKNE